MKLLLVIVLSILAVASCYLPNVLRNSGSKTNLFAHHPEKKIIKKRMDLRPIKHRLSDINRKNINLNKCITKVENAPPDYTIITAEEFEKIKAKANDFWENGDSEAEWHEITEDDKKCVLPQYTGDEKPYVAPKHLPLLKTGTRFQKSRDFVEKE